MLKRKRKTLVNFKKGKKYIANLSGKKAFVIGVLFALVFEGISCLFRFGFGLESTRDTAFMAPLTFGIRIHHGYMGLLLFLPLSFRKRREWVNLGVIIGTGLLLSDLIHHFIILWLFIGSPEFHWVYF